MHHDIESFRMHRTWRWRTDPEDRDGYLALETTDEGFRFFAWSHRGAGLVEEKRQSFDDFEREGPAWPLPHDIEQEARAWLAARRT